MSVGASWFQASDFESPEAYAAAKARKEAGERTQAIVDATIRAETNAREAPGLAAAAHEFWASASSRGSGKPIEPQPGSQQEINALERRLSVARSELDDFLQRTRYNALQRELGGGKLVGSALVNVTNFLNGWRPVFLQLCRTVEELSQQHRELIARRREAVSAGA